MRKGSMCVTVCVHESWNDVHSVEIRSQKNINSQNQSKDKFSLRFNFSFLQNLKVPVPDEIASDLGKFIENNLDKIVLELGHVMLFEKFQ